MSFTIGLMKWRQKLPHQLILRNPIQYIPIPAHQGNGIRKNMQQSTVARLSI